MQAALTQRLAAVKPSGRVSLACQPSTLASAGQTPPGTFSSSAQHLQQLSSAVRARIEPQLLGGQG
jgi:hypothetical protein